jgi:glycosyltransferase involved in cell wall biosynthesis
MNEPDDIRPSLLVLDMAYPLEMIRERGLENSVLCRDLDGFFRHVWSVHPMATLVTSDRWTPRFGKPVWHEMSDRHTFIEGKIGRFGALKSLFPLNFLMAQVDLFLCLWRLVRREGVRVIRVGDPLYLGLFGLALARLNGVPLVIRVNGNNQKVRENTGQAMFPRLFRSSRVEERIERFVFPRADLVAAPNQDNVGYAVAFGAEPNRVTIFRYGNLLADEHLVPPEQRGLDQVLFERLNVRPGHYLLSIARLVDTKFPDDILEAFAQAREASLDVDLVYAGDGPMQSQLAERARALGILEHVRFAGNQNQRALAQLNAHAAAVLSPLTGRALSEAALGAAPIVAYDLDWQSDLIETGKTGELVEFRRPDLLGAATIKLLQDPDYAARLGQGARERALELLDPAELNEHERQEYSELLSRYGSSISA